MGMSVLPEWMYAHRVCVPSACNSQKRTSDPQGPEFQMFESHHVSAENQTQVLYKQQVLSIAEPTLQPQAIF